MNLNKLAFTKIRLVLSLACIFNVNASHAQEQAQTPRLLELDASAFAGTSINVVAGSRQTLYTHGVQQYAAYYRADGSLVLAKRELGADTWEYFPTRFRTNLHDAHNTISLVVDGEGYLHLAWGHHNSTLNYARASAPHSMMMQQRKTMNEDLEQNVSYPQFYALPNGDLLFAYRDGGSGRGNLVLKYYDVKTRTWATRQRNLIDGENERSAYWDLFLDANAVLHLAWNWRETPDVASNHDLYYARSRDLGLTWEGSSGDKSSNKKYSLPFTLKNGERIAVIPEQHNLMNPPVVAADRSSKPYVVSYWSPEKNKAPQFQVLYKKDKHWLNLGGPVASEYFSLSGGGTKNPLLSRAALFVESDWSASWPHLVYRDRAQDGKILVASFNHEKKSWAQKILHANDVGAWEPSADPAQWQRMKQIHMLVQQVEQQDGNDQSSVQKSSAIHMLIWSPVWEKLQEKNTQRQQQKIKITKLPSAKKAFSKKFIRKTALKVADFHWEHKKEGWHYHRQGWGPCPLYIGSFDFAEITGNKKLLQRTKARAEENRFRERDNNPYDADDYCVNQLYFRLYKKYGDEKMRKPALVLFDRILADPSPHPLDWGYAHSRNRWSWSDALYMGPMAWLLATEVTDDPKYLAFMHREWTATTERLFKPDVGLYFRDESYFDLREANGKTVHWSRGTAWSIAGLAQIVAELPREDPNYATYVKQLQQMAAGFAAVQQEDGLWRPGLLDPQARPIRETSGSAFIAFAFASGINSGALSAEEYWPRVSKTWLALLQSVDCNGRLRDVQPVGAAPHDFDPENYEPFAAGAFLMLATELYKRAEKNGP